MNIDQAKAKYNEIAGEDDPPDDDDNIVSFSLAMLDKDDDLLKDDEDLTVEYRAAMAANMVMQCDDLPTVLLRVFGGVLEAAGAQTLNCRQMSPTPQPATTRTNHPET